MNRTRVGLTIGILAGGLTLALLGPTSPIGSANELRPYPEGIADAPFCVGPKAAPLACIWRDGGSFGFAGAAPAATPLKYVAADGTIHDGGIELITVTTTTGTGKPDGGFHTAFTARPTCTCTIGGASRGPSVDRGIQIATSATQWDIETGSNLPVECSCVGPI